MLHPTAAHPAEPVAVDASPSKECPPSWQMDPLLSTLRDVGGCVGVVLMGVLVSIAAAAARSACPPSGPGAIPSPSAIHRTP